MKLKISAVKLSAITANSIYIFASIIFLVLDLELKSFYHFMWVMGAIVSPALTIAHLLKKNASKMLAYFTLAICLGAVIYFGHQVYAYSNFRNDPISYTINYIFREILLFPILFNVYNFSVIIASLKVRNDVFVISKQQFAKTVAITSNAVFMMFQAINLIFTASSLLIKIMPANNPEFWQESANKFVNYITIMNWTVPFICSFFLITYFMKKNRRGFVFDAFVSLFCLALVLYFGWAVLMDLGKPLLLTITLPRFLLFLSSLIVLALPEPNPAKNVKNRVFEKTVSGPKHLEVEKAHIAPRDLNQPVGISG